MREREVKVGGYYAARINGRLVTVRVISSGTPDRGWLTSHGWYVKNLASGRTIYLRSARRLRYPVPPPLAA